MHVPFYGHTRQYHEIQEEIDATIAHVIESGQFILGPMLAHFERDWRQALAGDREQRSTALAGGGDEATLRAYRQTVVADVRAWALNR